MKKKAKKTMLFIFLGLLALIIIPTAFFGLRILFDLSNPLRQPMEVIREDLLVLTPIGTNMCDVIRVIEENEAWGWRGHIADVGFPADAAHTAFVGEQSIRVNIGGYTNIFTTGVVAWWGFDEDSKLLDIRVQKNIFGW